MKKLLYALVALVVISCASFQSNSGKFLASTAQTVDVAMKAYALYVVQNNVPPEQQTAIRSDYGLYRSAMNAASNAWVLGDPTQFGVASNNLVSARTKLLSTQQTIIH